MLRTKATPDHSYFGKLRKRIGTKRVATFFNEVNAVFESRGLFGNVFTFIDSSSIITKTALWGAKSKTNIWFGHQRHDAVDMRYGLIKKVTVTVANVQDFAVVKSIAPKDGTVFMDKMYDTKKTDLVLRARGLHPSTLRKNTNPEKNRDLDRWRSGIRMPFESTFSKQSKFARYRGHAKVTMQCFFEALVYNMKKAVRVLKTAFGDSRCAYR